MPPDRSAWNAKLKGQFEPEGKGGIRAFGAARVLFLPIAGNSAARLAGRCRPSRSPVPLDRALLLGVVVGFRRVPAPELMSHTEGREERRGHSRRMSSASRSTGRR
jgi:hypothetical protein